MFAVARLAALKKGGCGVCVVPLPGETALHAANADLSSDKERLGLKRRCKELRGVL